ncbi:Retrovirus-related Pol polyprotein from transposon opus [Vitis vinifera]|uniref:Retrovirus-related Pol polyprotein from transposon opus n=1 Tax=Vitis vinifera TaxID=29760 RepID=A0A438FCS3_VITVI|nr:Retrovirus-related Pol polyprotein from transposon opus [Vitis vinifera]
MVPQGIVLGHIISSQGIEVDKEKVELIVKLTSPTTIKGVRQFLDHAGFYRRFIKDFFKLARPLLRAPNWHLPFEVMCNASDFAIGVVLGQREDGKPYVIYYASKTLNKAQRNYTTIEKELLAVVFALDKFRTYLVGWIFLLQEFNLHIKDKKEVENVVADYLSRIAIAHNSHSLPINDDFPEESLMLIEASPWYAHIANYLVTGEVPNQIIQKCIPEQEQQGILNHCHESACGGHFTSQKTAMKVLQSGPFPMSFGYSYILVGVDYVSKWVEAIPCNRNDHRVVLKFLKENIFS